MAGAARFECGLKIVCLTVYAAQARGQNAGLRKLSGKASHCFQETGLPLVVPIQKGNQGTS